MQGFTVPSAPGGTGLMSRFKKKITKK